ncbi:MAG: LysR family transcriptional regulator [Coriobacteriia bacterium]|nr:LysR family transcriptional regulator [Coriobacteriia bacterium]MCL2749647.1 LysR family transcriptional regulator [Coriobacteriia bacterium]
MKIDYLREYIVIGSSSSLQEAAQKLYLSSSTLSKHLSFIEEEVGTKLFKRSTTSLEFTVAGERFFEKAIAIINLYDAALTNPEQPCTSLPVVTVGGHLQCSLAYRLLMTTSSLVAHHNSPVHIVPYIEHYNGSLHSLASNDPYRTINDELVDVSLLIAASSVPQGFNCMVICNERLTIAAPENHPFARSREALSVCDLGSETFVFSQAYPEFTQQFIARCKESEVRPKIRQKAFQTWGDMYVKRNDSDLFVFPRSFAERLPPQEINGLVKRDIDDAIDFEIWALWSKDNPNEGIPIFLDKLLEVVELLKPEAV